MTLLFVTMEMRFFKEIPDSCRREGTAEESLYSEFQSQILIIAVTVVRTEIYIIWK